MKKLIVRNLDALGAFCFGILLSSVQLTGSYGPDETLALVEHQLQPRSSFITDWFAMHIPPSFVGLLAVLLTGICFMFFYVFVRNLSSSQWVAAASLGVSSVYFQYSGLRDPLLNTLVQTQLGCSLAALGLAALTLDVRGKSGRKHAAFVVIGIAGSIVCATGALLVVPVAALLESRTSTGARFPLLTLISVAIGIVGIAVFHLSLDIPSLQSVAHNVLLVIPGVGRLDAGFVSDVLTSALHDVTFDFLPSAGILGWIVALLACGAGLGLFWGVPDKARQYYVLGLLGCLLFAGRDLDLLRWLATGGAVVLCLLLLRTRPLFNVIVAGCLVMIFFGAYGSVRGNSVVTERVAHFVYKFQIFERAAAVGLFNSLPSNARVFVSPNSFLADYFGNRDITWIAKNHGCCHGSGVEVQTWRLSLVAHRQPPLPNVVGLTEISRKNSSTRGVLYEEFWDAPQATAYLSSLHGAPGIRAVASRSAPTHVLVIAHRTCGSVLPSHVFDAQQPALHWGTGFYPRLPPEDVPYADYPSLGRIPGVFLDAADLHFAINRASFILPPGCNGKRAVFDLALVAYAPGPISIQYAGKSRIVELSLEPTDVTIIGDAHRAVPVTLLAPMSSAPPYTLSPRIGSVHLPSTAMAIALLAAHY